MRATLLVYILRSKLTQISWSYFTIKKMPKQLAVIFTLLKALVASSNVQNAVPPSTV